MSVPHALLALLSEGPKFGLRLQTEFESRTGEVWPLNVGQVYTTLQRLERDGLVESDDGEAERSRKLFRITAAGARELGEWLRTPPELVPPPRDELVIKVLVALQVPAPTSTRSAGAPPACDRGHAALHPGQGGCRGRRCACARRRRRALSARAIVRWLDAADVRLKQLPPQVPTPPADVPLQPTRTMEVSRDERTGTASGIEGVRLGAERSHALSEVNLSVERGELVAVMGERIGQEHAVDDRRQPGGRRAARCSWTGSTWRPSRARTGRSCDAARSATCSRTSTCSPG